MKTKKEKLIEAKILGRRLGSDSKTANFIKKEFIDRFRRHSPKSIETPVKTITLNEWELDKIKKIVEKQGQIKALKERLDCINCDLESIVCGQLKKECCSNSVKEILTAYKEEIEKELKELEQN